MNLLATGSLENLLVLLVFAGLGGLSAWLTKKRGFQKAWGDPPNTDELALSPGTPGGSTRPLDLQTALRQLLLGVPLPQAPPPPSAFRDKSSRVPADEEHLQPKRMEINETQEVDKHARHLANHTAEASRGVTSWAPSIAKSLETVERPEKAARRYEQVHHQPRRPATVVSGVRRVRRCDGARAVALVRDSHTVRLAFIASLVFGSPKALETDHGCDRHRAHDGT
jgi:hypothetical protein